MLSTWLKLSRGLFLLNGITSILIGVTHTYAHYAELVSDDIRRRLDKEIVVMGSDSNIWDLWQGMSLMMGILLIIVGLMMVMTIWNLKKAQYPPLNISLIFILMLITVVYSGVNYFGTAQVYGGIAGIVLQSASVLFSRLGIRNDAISDNNIVS